MKNIVILGGGFGGLRVAIELSKHRGKLKDYKIILIDKNIKHTFTPLIYEVATGFFEYESWREELALTRGAEVTIPKILEVTCRDCVEFVVGEVQSIDLSGKKLFITPSKEIDFEYLVIALGSESDYFGVEGLEKYSVALKEMKDAVLIRQKINDFIHKKAARKGIELQVIIGGGGATGVEFAAELASFFKNAVKHKLLKNGDFSISLIEGGSRLVNFAPEGASRVVYNHLTNSGIKVLLDTCIKKVADSRLLLSPRDLKPGELPENLACSMLPGEEKEMSYDILVWAGGIRAVRLLASSGFEVDKKDRVAIDEYCRVKGREKIFAIGDAAVYLDVKSGKFAPWLAQTAIEQGYVATSRLLNEILGSSAKPYKLHPYPTLLPMGAKKVLFVYDKLYFNGLLAWLTHEAVSFRYFISILGLKEGFKTWLRGAWVYSKND